MNRLLLFLLLFPALEAIAQPNQLFVKKGVFKKRIYSEGDRLHVRLYNGVERTGIITNLRDSIIYLNGEEIRVSDVALVIVDGIKKNRLPDTKTMLLIGGGVGLTTVGLTLNNANDFKTAALSAAVIGFGPLLIKFIGGRILYAFHRKKYKMGKKFRLQVFDIRVPYRKGF